MSRRKNVERSGEPTMNKPPTRVPRRRRRKPFGGRPQTPAPSGKQLPQDGSEAALTMHSAEPAPIRISRAPRPAEAPPPNPNVFSYTFTIWKSS